MASRDFYGILDVPREASADEIKRAYRKAAMKHHPDRNPGDTEAEERFKEAAEAYSVLGDPERRARYDRFGEAGVRGGPQMDSEIFGDFADILGDFFGFNFGFGRGRGGRVQRGASLRTEIEIDLEQAATGDTVTIQVGRRCTCDDCGGTGAAPGSSRMTCPDCGGRGQVHQQHGFLTLGRTCGRCGGSGSTVESPCTGCGGQGRRVETPDLKIDIPAGVDTGMRMLVRGEGESGIGGGPAGDLEVVIRVREHASFIRREGDLLVRIPITFPKAVLGAEVEVPTLVGEPETLRIPAGTQSGKVFEIKGRGMPSVNGGRPGALRVAVQVVTPRHVEDRERELIEELDELMPEPGSIEDSEETWWDRLRSVFGG